MSRKLDELQHKANHLKHLLVMSQIFGKGFTYCNNSEISKSKVVEIKSQITNKLTLKDLVIEQQNLIDDLLDLANHIKS